MRQRRALHAKDAPRKLTFERRAALYEVVVTYTLPPPPQHLEPRVCGDDVLRRVAEAAWEGMVCVDDSERVVEVMLEVRSVCERSAIARARGMIEPYLGPGGVLSNASAVELDQ